MQRLSRLYVSHFGSATAWYDHLLFNLDDPDTNEPTDAVFNLENAGGKTSLLAFIFSCFDPKLERWLQHLQKRSHRFAEYFSRDGRPAFLIMEWRMPARLPSATDYRLIVGQAVTVRESAERGSDIDRWFFSYAVTEELLLETLPLPGFSTSPVRTMHEFVQWMFQAAKRSKGDFFHTKTQEDWVRHLGGARLLDIELLRMQVDFNSNEGGMEEGFLTFNTELDLLRRFLALTLDGSKCATVRDAVAQTADKLRQKPKFERRLTQLNRLQGVMLPFADAASGYTRARETHQVKRRTLAGLGEALTHRRQLNLESEERSRTHAREQQNVAQTSTKTASLRRDENLLLEGMLLERRVATAKELKGRTAQSLLQARYRKRCLEGANAWVHVEATRARRDELEGLYESEKEGLKPARQHAEIQGRPAAQRAETSRAGYRGPQRTGSSEGIGREKSDRGRPTGAIAYRADPAVALRRAGATRNIHALLCPTTGSARP